MDIDILGSFKISENEYAVGSYEDSKNNCKIVILEILRDGENIKVKPISKKDKDNVLAKYKEIEKYLLGGN